MDNQPAANIPSRKSPGHLWPWIFVLVVLLFVGFIRFRLLDMPLERDEGEYAYAGQLILQGIPPYELAYNMKLPGTYYAYAAGMAVFGETTRGIHLTLIVANSLTVIFVFLLGRKLFGVVAGLVACASYGLMSVSPLVLGIEAHATHFVVLFAVPATLLLLLAAEKKSNYLLFFSGVLYGLAFFMKQQGMFFILFGVIYLFGQGVKHKTMFTRGFISNFFLFGTGAGLALLFFCAVIFWSGNFARFWFWTFVYAREYATAVPLYDGPRLLGNHLLLTFYPSVGFWGLAVIGMLLGVFNQRLRKPALMVMVLWVCSFMGTATGLYFRGHYFILLLPAFAILTGLAVVAMQQVLRFPGLPLVSQSLPLILYGLVFYWAVLFSSQLFFQLTPRQVVASVYQENPFEEAQIVGDYLRTNSAPEAQIGVIGSEPEIYFYAHRHSATGYIYTYPLMEPQPAALTMQKEMIGEIETNRPEYLVRVNYELSWLTYPHSSPLIKDWAAQYEKRFYRPIGVVRDFKGSIESNWGDAVTNMALDDGLVVYQRKSDAN